MSWTPSKQCSRRRLLLTSATVGSLASLLGGPLRTFAAIPGLPYVDKIGLQLYTVRNQMAEDAAGTLAAIAKAGYHQVELMDVGESGLRVAAIARDQGLAVHSGFIDWRSITRPGGDSPSIERIIDFGGRIGLRHLVLGYIDRDDRGTADQCKAIAESANRAAELTRVAGMRMCYHNHSFEFQAFAPGRGNTFDLFIERFDKKWMEFELDVFWVKLGGGDPIRTMQRLGSRISQIHLKDIRSGVGVITDEASVPADAFEELGDGTIDIPKVMRLADRLGVEFCHVEQDQSPAPLESIRKSLQHLTG